MDIGGACQGVADDHGIVGFGRKVAVRFVSDGDIVEGCAGFEGKGRDDGDVLIRDQLHEGNFGLVSRLDALYIAKVSQAGGWRGRRKWDVLNWCVLWSEA